jgi:hypothetical protein
MRLPLLSLSLITTTLVACGGDAPPSPTDVRTSLRQDLAHVLGEGLAATEATANLPSGDSFGFATIALGSIDGSTARVLAPLTRRISARLTGPGDKPSRRYVDPETQMDVDALIDQLEQELFNDANYVGDGVYKVPAWLVCETWIYDVTTGAESTSIDPDCAAKLDDVQLRIRVASEDDGIRFYVQVDADHDEPLSLYLDHDDLKVTVNLDDAGDAMIALAQITGEQAPNADLAGQITGSLHIVGAAHARVALSFDRAISIKFAEDGVGLDSDGAYKLTSAAGEVIGVELDANTPGGSLDLGLGATTAHILGDELDPASRDIALGGATVNASFQGSTLTFDNISLGSSTTTVSVGGQQAIAIDLNPADGRKLSATITADIDTGDETVSVSPRLDLQTSVDHAVLGDEAPVYDVTRVQLDGSLRGNELTSEVEVLTGSLTVTTNPAQYGFSANAGECVQETEVYDDVTFESYSTFTVGACQ